MAYLRPADETDDQGRRRVIAWKPERDRELPDGWVQADYERPEDVRPGDRATAWLTDADEVEWEIERAPDVDGALDAMEDTLSRGRVRAILRDYPDVLSAMSRGRWERAWDGLADAHEAGDLSDDDMDALRRIGAEHNVPVPEDT